MKIGKRTISFSGKQEIYDLKVAMGFAGTTTISYLRHTADDPTCSLNILLVENKSNTEAAIMDMFSTACQCYRILDFSEKLGLLRKREVTSARKCFTTIRRFCENEMIKLNKKS